MKRILAGLIVLLAVLVPANAQDMWMDVDAALSEVPVNILPLIDDTDFKTIEDAIAYNAGGMDLTWNFVTTAGAFSSTAVTPTTGGTHDWAEHTADDGMYTLEIPASGGTINNDTEGFGWFTGVCTGVLPWRGPTIGFRAAAMNNSMIDASSGIATLDDFFDTDSGETSASAVAGSVVQEIVDLVVTDVVEGYNLDHLAKTATAGADMTTEVADNTILSRILANGDTSAFVPSTDGLQPIRDQGDAAWTTGGGTGLTYLATGTAQAGSANTITLAAGADATDDTFKWATVVLTANTGAPGFGVVKSYNGTSKVATIYGTWRENPDATTTYEIQAGIGPMLVAMIQSLF